MNVSVQRGGAAVVSCEGSERWLERGEGRCACRTTRPALRRCAAPPPPTSTPFVSLRNCACLQRVLSVDNERGTRSYQEQRNGLGQRRSARVRSRRAARARRAAAERSQRAAGGGVLALDTVQPRDGGAPRARHPRRPRRGEGGVAQRPRPRRCAARDGVERGVGRRGTGVRRLAGDFSRSQRRRYIHRGLPRRGARRATRRPLTQPARPLLLSAPHRARRRPLRRSRSRWTTCS